MRDRGFAVEAYVASYLEQQGLELVSQNFNCKLGEIDLILKEQKTLVFTEVRYRKNSKFGSSLETVTPAKQRKLINTAGYFLQKNRWAQDLNCRFDVVGVNPVKSPPGSGTQEALEINWIKNAFWAS